MPLTNAEKQKRFRERKVIVLTHDANDIAERLIELHDQDELRATVRKLRKVASFVADHLRHPDRNPFQQAIALGRAQINSLNGPLPKLAAIAASAEAAAEKVPDQSSWRVEAVSQDGQRWHNGVSFATREEAEVYVDGYARFEVPGYARADILPLDQPPQNSIIRRRKGGRPTLLFADGTCTLLGWQPVETPCLVM
jgi:hypothetical protein